MLISELALIVKMYDKRLKYIAQILVLIKRVNNLKRLSCRYFHYLVLCQKEAIWTIFRAFRKKPNCNLINFNEFFEQYVTFDLGSHPGFHVATSFSMATL